MTYSSLSPSICLSGSSKFDGSSASPEENLSGFVQADLPKRIKAHGIFTVWSPDEVAECMDDVSDELCRALWDLVKLYPKKKRSECNDDFSDRCLKKFWRHLSREQQIELNALAVAHEAAEEAAMVEARKRMGF